MWKHPSPQSICPCFSPPSEVTISTNDRRAVPMVTDSHRRVRLPKTLFRICLGLFLHLRPQALSRRFFVSSIYWSSESTRVKGLSSGYRRVFSKDLLFQVGLAQWKVIHSNTLEANEKAPQDVVQRASEWRNTHQFKTCRPGALQGKP